MVKYKTIEKEYFSLTLEAEEIILNGSHEARVFNAISLAKDGLTLDELKVYISYFLVFS